MNNFDFIVTAIMVTLNPDCKATSYTIVFTIDAQKRSDTRVSDLFCAPLFNTLRVALKNYIYYQ